jgi:hypothetical protein
MFQRVEKPQTDSTKNLIQGAWLIAGGIAAAIYFLKDLASGKMEILEVGGLLLSLISGITGYHLIKKGLRHRE